LWLVFIDDAQQNKWLDNTYGKEPERAQFEVMLEYGDDDKYHYQSVVPKHEHMAAPKQKKR